jgi:predicted metal-dependent hydrolase
VQLEFPFVNPDSLPGEVPPSSVDAPPPGAQAPAVLFVRARRARKYILRVRPDGSLRVTIPRGGSRREAEAFLEKHRTWAERERLRAAQHYAPLEWREGQSVLLHGQPVALVVERDARGRVLALGGMRIRLGDDLVNLRPAAEAVLRRMAIAELPPRIRELAAAHGLTVTKTTIRNQRSRWGSCSRSGAIALNFRLVQMPPAVCDYVLLHELMHLREPNHSRRYWRHVEAVCPAFRDAERWLTVEGRSLF